MVLHKTMNIINDNYFAKNKELKIDGLKTEGFFDHGRLLEATN